MWDDWAGKSFRMDPISPLRGARRVLLLPAAMALALAAAACLPAAVARADDTDTYWNAATSSWSDANCWSKGEPNSRISAYIDNGGTVLVNRAGEAGYWLRIGSTSGLSGAINITAGSLSCWTEYVGKGGTGTFRLAPLSATPTASLIPAHGQRPGKTAA